MATPLPTLHPTVETAIQSKLQRGTRQISRRTQRRLFLVLLVLSDVILLVTAFAAAYAIRFHSGLDVFREDVVPDPSYYARLGFVLVIVWLTLFWAFRLYDQRTLLGGTREYAAIFQASLAGTIMVALVQFVSEEFVVARGWVGLTWILVFLCVVVGRFSIRRLGYAARRRGYLVSPVLIMGANEEGRLLARQLLTWPTSGLVVVGFLDDGIPPGTRVAANLYVLGNLASVATQVEQYGIENLILAASALPRQIIADVFRRYGQNQQMDLHISSGLFELTSTPLEVRELAYIPLIGMHQSRLTGLDAVLKALLDYTLTLAALALLWPILVALAILIKTGSPGPVFHRRRVLGLNGRPFDALKFRTMYVDGDSILAAHPELQAELTRAHKLKRDPRVTPIGRFLRKYSLDELPQLFNVLARQMSLVGPRMITAAELNQYEQSDMNLMTVRPGLTGLWQVSGRSDVSYADRVRLDMYYVRNYNIWLDLQIIWQTIPVVLSGKGAY